MDKDDCHDPLSRRSLAALTLCTLALPALAQGPITLIVGWPAGGPSDNVARLAATRMSEALGQPITIDNRAGAGGNLGSDAAARARPDGNTIMLATVASHGLNSALYAKLNHDPLKDFAPIGMITTSPSVLLVPVDSPLRSVQDLLAAARARPGQLNYGSGGVGSSQHLAGASFKQLTGVDVTHIPYKGTAPAMTDLMAGRVDFVLTTGAIPFIRSGKLRAWPWPRASACRPCRTCPRSRKPASRASTPTPGMAWSPRPARRARRWSA